MNATAVRAKVTREQILSLGDEYFQQEFADRPFNPGFDPVPVSGKLLDSGDLRHLLEASLDLWLTTGRFAHRFEREFAKNVGARSSLLVNSGSSANLCALSALTSPKLGDRRLKPGDEVITVAAGFPTTVNPIIQNGLTPVFVDVHVPTYNVDPAALENAIGPKTRAIMLAHTLGNPFDLETATRLAKEHDLWLIEDTCDALGATYNGQKVGTFGDLSTYSFYPAHHITMGEGGAVAINAAGLHRVVESFRDWGRDCWCEPGASDTCKQRFEWKLGELPCGYDHKYTYSHIGYNLKATDMQAALGLSQLSKLDAFVEQRKKNFDYLRSGMEEFQDHFILPQATPDSCPSPFGFALAVRPSAPFDRHRLIQFLEVNKIGTRLLFGGNLTKQPAYRDANFRVSGSLDQTDFVMERVFWIGVWPGLQVAHLDYVLDTFRRFINS